MAFPVFILFEVITALQMPAIFLPVILISDGCIWPGRKPIGPDGQGDQSLGKGPTKSTLGT